MLRRLASLVLVGGLAVSLASLGQTSFTMVLPVGSPPRGGVIPTPRSPF